MSENPFGNLLAGIPYRHLLRCLGVPAPTMLPCRTQCPLCKKHQLSIFDDEVWGGQWFYCGSCQEAGDMVRLAALSFGKSFDATLVSLRRQGISVKVSQRQKLRHEQLSVRWRRASEFWVKASEQSYAPSTGAAGLVQTLHWQCHVPLERRLATSGSLFGWATKREIEDFLHECEEWKKDSGGSRVFKGKDWDDSLVVPNYSVPRRLNCLLVIGRDADPEKDFVFRPYEYVSNELRDRAWTEAGLAMHPGAIRAGREWDRHIVAIRDPVAAIQLQCYHLERAHYPLPIVNWHWVKEPGRRPIITRTSWKQLYRRKIVFWMPVPCAMTIAQAIETGGLISTYKPPRPDYDVFFYSVSSYQVVKTIIASAVPWQTALAELLEKLPDSQAEELLLSLEAVGVDIGAITEKHSAQLRSRVFMLLDTPRQTSSVQFNRSTIYAQGDHWYRQANTTKGNAKGRPELIADGLFEIQQVVNHPTLGQVYYSGRAKYGGAVMNFYASKQDFDRQGGLSWLQQFLLSKQKGLLRFNRNYDKHAVDIAVQLHPPKFLTGMDRVGWDDVHQRLVFPQFSLALGGEVKKHNASLFIAGAPCRDLDPPTGCSAEEIGLLTKDEAGTGILWATLAAIATNMLGHVVKRQYAVGLSGSGAVETARVVASACQLPTISFSEIRDLQRMRPVIEHHRCPTFVKIRNECRPGAIRLWFSELPEQSHNALVETNFWMSRAKRLTDGWLVLEADRAAAISGPTLDALGVFLTNFLRWMSQRNFELEGEELPLAVLSRMEEFVESLSDKANTVRLARRHLRGHTPEDRAEAFAEIMSELVLKQAIKFELEPIHKTDPNTTIVSDRKHLYVSRKLWIAQMNAKCSFAPDCLTVTTALANAGKLIGENADSWLVNAPWWLEIYTRYKAEKTGLLTLVG
jgi:hypothetical protein